jgi:DNA-binding response OmpR family regulator
MKWTLLYFDDQPQNVEVFKEVLSDKFSVVGTTDATSYPHFLENYHPHVILLDVHMPILDGHALYKKISEHPFYNGCPVIFISGDASDENKIKSYQGGGIDFFPRDLKIDEIAVRLENKVKFYLQMSASLELGNLKIDVKSMKGSIGDKNVDLTLLELRMLGHILRAYPQPLTRQDLIDRVWGNDSVKPGTINTHLTNLKPKIDNWDHQIKVREENIIIQKKDKI